MAKKYLIALIMALTSFSVFAGGLPPGFPVKCATGEYLCGKAHNPNTPYKMLLAHSGQGAMEEFLEYNPDLPKNVTEETIAPVGKYFVREKAPK